MSIDSAPSQDAPGPHLFVRLIVSVAVVSITTYFGRILYDAFFGPLSRFPGPKLRAVSKLPGIYTTVTGRDAFVRAELHEQYGPIVRINPTEISFASGAEAWEAIYGFKKQKPPRDPQFYAVGVNGCPDVVTADDENHSRQRKILSTGFSEKAIKGYEPLLKSWAQKMIAEMSKQAKKAGKVDMLKYLNCTTFDIMGEWMGVETMYMSVSDDSRRPSVRRGLEHARGRRAITLGPNHLRRIQSRNVLALCDAVLGDHQLAGREATIQQQAGPCEAMGEL